MNFVHIIGENPKIQSSIHIEHHIEIQLSLSYLLALANAKTALEMYNFIV